MSVPKICFDAMLWDAILTGDTSKDLDSCRGWMKRATEMKVSVVVPTIIVAEVHANPDRNAVEQFRKTLSLPCIKIVDVSVGIAEFSGDLRREVLNKKWELKAFDSLVIATAEKAGCKYVFSEDGRVQRMDRYHCLTVRCVPPHEGLDDHPLFEGCDLES